jgi:hypothetical protein
MEKFDLLTAAQSNWIALRGVLTGCSLSADEQLARVDLDELFVIEGIYGVFWMFEELQWLDEDAVAQHTRFEAAVAALDSLGDAAYDDDVVKGAAEWAELRTSAAALLAAIPDRPWVVA